MADQHEGDYQHQSACFFRALCWKCPAISMKLQSSSTSLTTGIHSSVVAILYRISTRYVLIIPDDSSGSGWDNEDGTDGWTSTPPTEIWNHRWVDHRPSGTRSASHEGGRAGQKWREEEAFFGQCIFIINITFTHIGGSIVGGGGTVSIYRRKEWRNGKSKSKRSGYTHLDNQLIATRIYVTIREGDENPAQLLIDLLHLNNNN